MGDFRASDFQSVATPATSATWPPAERQTAPGGSMGCMRIVKPQDVMSNRVEYDEDGYLDEVVTDAGMHLERMSDTLCRFCLRPEVQADGWCRKCGNHAGDHSASCHRRCHICPSRHS